MPDANDTNLNQFESVSGAPRMPRTDAPVIPATLNPISRANLERAALVNVVTYEGDNETDRGTIEIPLDAFERAHRDPCSVDYSEGSMTITLGTDRGGISIHICPKGD